MAAVLTERHGAVRPACWPQYASELVEVEGAVRGYRDARARDGSEELEDGGIDVDARDALQALSQRQGELDERLRALLAEAEEGRDLRGRLAGPEALSVVQRARAAVDAARIAKCSVPAEG